MSVKVTRWGSHDPRVTTVVGKKDGRRLLSDTATACGSRARRRSIRRVVDTAKKSRKVVHGVSRSRTPSLEAPPIRRRARTGWGCEAPRGRAPGSARRRGGLKVRDECAEPEDSFPRALARPLRRSSRSGGASRRWKAPMRIILKISPGRGATHGDREPCEALDAELACLFARTYLVATARARRTVRRPRRDAAEGLSAALDSEMAAMTAKDVVSPAGARTIGGTGASAGNALVSRGVGDEMRPAETSCRSRRVRTSRGTEPNERTRREERPLARGGVLARRALRGRRRNLEASADFCSSQIF